MATLIPWYLETKHSSLYIIMQIRLLKRLILWYLSGSHTPIRSTLRGLHFWETSKCKDNLQAVTQTRLWCWCRLHLTLTCDSNFIRPGSYACLATYPLGHTPNYLFGVIGAATWKILTPVRIELAAAVAAAAPTHQTSKQIIPKKVGEKPKKTRLSAF